jgi:hypothetical protein
MLDMDRGIAAEQIDFVRSDSKDDRGLGDVGAVDLILDAISGLVSDPHRLGQECLFSCGYGSSFSLLDCFDRIIGDVAAAADFPD